MRKVDLDASDQADGRRAICETERVQAEENRNGVYRSMGRRENEERRTKGGSGKEKESRCVCEREREREGKRVCEREKGRRPVVRWKQRRGSRPALAPSPDM